MSTEIQVSAFSKKLEENRFALISMIILIVGCLGGVTVGFRAIESVTALALVIFPTMATLSMLLAVAPMRMILILAGITVSIDILLLSYYLLIG